MSREYQQPAASICGSATRSNYAIPFDANIVHSTPIKVEQHLFADTINKGDATNMDDATLMSESNSENEFDAPAPTLNNTNVEYSNVNHEQPQPKNNRRFYPATSGYREDPAAMVHPDRRVNRLPFDGIAAASSRYSTVNNNAYAPRETSIRPHLNRRATPHNYSNGAAAPSRFPTFPAWNGRENSSSYLMPPENNTRYSPSPSRPATNTPDVHPFRFSSRQERRERTKSFQKNSQPPPAKDSPPKIDPKKVAFKQYFKDLLQSYMNNLNIDEAARSLIENISTYSNPTFCLEGIFEYCCQDLIYNAVQERNAASMLLLKCLQEDSTLKNVFSSAFKNYSNFIVENNIETDDENLILKFPEFFAYIWINDTSKILPTSAFIDGFKPLHENESSLFPRCLSAFGRLANPQGQLKVGERMGMLYHEFVAADSYYKSKQIQKVLEKFLFSYGKYHNLKNLLESMHCFKTYKN
uniref:Uncharacterized protein n=1 Tax=Panagrolaimus sp. ES5 TaxID=591445 RepID=A0AC34EZQ3_9BILA